MRLMLILAFAVTPSALAQFTDIAVTDDARQIYLVSSLPLRGESGPGGGIYRWSGERWEQFAPPFVNTPGRDPFRSTYVRAPVVSGGGTVVAWTEEHRCMGGSSCISYPTYWVSVIATADGQRTSIPGRVQVSRNGRYVIQAQEVYIFSTPYRVTRTYRDLETGIAIDLDFPLHGVLSDGRVLGSDAQGWFLWSPSGPKHRIAGTSAFTLRGFSTPFVSDNGASIVTFRNSTGGEPDAVAIAVDTGRQTSLGRGIPVGISNDGLRALLVESYPSRQAYIVDTLAGTRSHLVPGTGVNAAALAGFGRVAVLATTDGRLLKVNVDSGRAEELIVRTPLVSWPSAASPCSAFRLDGTNLTTASEKPVVTLDDEPIPILAASDTVVWAQIPCELEPSDAFRELDVKSDSPFGVSSPRRLRRSFPERVSVTVHQDFSGPVTRDQPAVPGEIVHVWGTGFGPVDRAMRTGEPGPASPPARLLDPVTCRDTESGAPSEVLFAGLAPGLVGFYQLDLRVPAEAAEFSGIVCTLPEGVSVAFVVPTKPQP
jgi:uncharacterized protein (TIGR03437 family)